MNTKKKKATPKKVTKRKKVQVQEVQEPRLNRKKVFGISLAVLIAIMLVAYSLFPRTVDEMREKAAEIIKPSKAEKEEKEISASPKKEETHTIFEESTIKESEGSFSIMATIKEYREYLIVASVVVAGLLYANKETIALYLAIGKGYLYIT